MNDKKMRIEVGYGLEGAIPDGLAGSIITDTIAPYFKESRFDDGLKAGVNAVAEKILTENNIDPAEFLSSYGSDVSSAPPPKAIKLNLFQKIIGLIIAIFLIILFIKNPGLFFLLLFSGRGGGGWSSGGGGFSGGFGGFGGGMSGGGGASGGW